MAKVIIDPGHGGWDNGAQYQGRREKDDNLNIALAVGNILTLYGFQVYYTRTEDVYESPYQKAVEGNARGGELFLSIHRNASPFPNQYNGVESLIYSGGGFSQLVAENINGQLERIGFRNAGIEERKNLVVLNSTVMPAVLVEVGFINSDVDNLLLDSIFTETAYAIADGVAMSFFPENYS
ncbi:MAG: N-acetylmuramoyl-L-alanine amidase [Lachnospiraceae bacterium]|nr:N-acetylmuramoyl-L-alanine amidase [Lachnospiraceae bacterium]